MTGAIGHGEIARSQIITHRNSISEVGGLTIGLNPTQIEGFINGANNLDSRTLGWGMTFMHETIHSKVGGGLSDRPFSDTFSDRNPGPTATKMNAIRSELNAQGGNYGTRMTYPGLLISGSHYIPFCNGSYTSVMNGGATPVERRHKYIKF